MVKYGGKEEEAESIIRESEGTRENIVSVLAGFRTIWFNQPIDVPHPR